MGGLRLSNQKVTYEGSVGGFLPHVNAATMAQRGAPVSLSLWIDVRSSGSHDEDKSKPRDKD